jgi:hypothetical protein
MIELFISYRSADSNRVDPVVAQLRSVKDKDKQTLYHVWQDKDSIPVGQDWWEAICEGIDNTFAIFIEKYSHRMVFDGKHIQQTEN